MADSETISKLLVLRLRERINRESARLKNTPHPGRARKKRRKKV